MTCCALFRDWAADAPDEITALVNLTTAPPLPVIPAEWHGKKVAAFIAVSAGPPEEGESLVRAFREVAEPIADLLGPMPYHVIQTLIDPLWEKGIHAYFKATNLARLDDELIDRLCEHPPRGARAAVRDPRAPDGRRGRARRPTAQPRSPSASMPFVLNAVTGWHDPAVGASHSGLGARGDRGGRRTRRPAAPTSTSSATPTQRAPRTATRRTRASSR